jgi:hypothetical protein
MINKSFASMTRQITDELSLTFVSSFESGYKYNSPQLVQFEILKGDNKFTVNLTIDDLSSLSVAIRNVMDVAMTIPHKDNGDE